MYNNPFMYQNLYRPGLLSRLFGGSSLARTATSGINWGNILSNTQKGLGIINQAIPLVHQVKPIINNAKTMFKIADALKDDKKISTSNQEEKKIEQHISSTNENKPIFFI